MRTPSTPLYPLMETRGCRRNFGKNRAEGGMGRQKEVPVWSWHSGTHPGAQPCGPSYSGGVTAPQLLSLSFQLSGFWFSILMASDNMTRIGENGDLRLFIQNIVLLKNGSLLFDFLFMCVSPPKLKLGETVSHGNFLHSHICCTLSQCVACHQPFLGNQCHGVRGCLARC